MKSAMTLAISVIFLMNASASAVEGDDPTEHAENAERLGVYVSRRLASVGTPQDIPNVGYGPVTNTSRVEEIVCSGEWAWIQSAGRVGCDWATSVIACESGGNPNAYNPAGHVGWWQIRNGSYDPYLNTIEANIQFIEWQGPEAWRVDSPWPGCAPYPP